jgi:hypothetical protein
MADEPAPDESEEKGEPAAEPSKDDAQKEADEGGPEKRTEESDFRDSEKWLKDQDRVRESAGFTMLLEQAIAELAGGKVAFEHSGVLIVGDVNLTGDLVGGDKYGGAEKRSFLGEVVVGEVPAEVLEQNRQAFVEPFCYARLEDTLETHSVVLLQASSGWGRTTTALHVLGGLCPEGVRKLNPDTTLRKLNAEKEFKKPGGYLVEIRAVDQLTGFKVPHLEELSAACGRAGVRLVVTVDDDIPLDSEVRTEFVVPGGTRPNPETVLRRHLDLRLGGADPDTADDTEVAGEVGPTAATVLSEEAVRALVTEVVEDPLSMRRLVELADKLARVAMGRLDLDTVRTHFSEQSEQNFGEWFDQMKESEQRAFVIALAAFNGMSYFTVARASQQLEERIRRVEEGDEDEGRPVFGTRRKKRVDGARAKLVMATDFTRYGPTRVEAVRFRNEGYPGRVLEWVWREYDEVRPLLLDWLRDLGVDGDRAVRVRAAAAVGLLATFDFDRICRDILLPWANDDYVWARESAVSALCVPRNLRPELAVHVIRMVHDWTRKGNNLNRQWTAARALGTSIGQSIRPQAIKLLFRAAGRNDLDLSFAVGDSMQELFIADEADAQRDVMRALKRWTSDSTRADSAARKITGVICFLQLAFNVTAEDPESRSTWPGLLWLAVQDDHFDLLALLWRRAMRTPHFFLAAQDAFADWVHLADDEPAPDPDDEPESGDEPGYEAPPAQLRALERLLRLAIEDRHDRDRFTQSIDLAVEDHGETGATRHLLDIIEELEQHA